MHGYGGGYLPPVLRTRSTSHAPVPDFVFEQNMTVVIQPNVVTTDNRAGVQVGELKQPQLRLGRCFHGCPR